MSEWQPIETAPKDGRKIDLCNKKGARITDCSWHRKKECWQAMLYVKYAGGKNAPIGKSFKPTHWMPLPKAPE